MELHSSIYTKVKINEVSLSACFIGKFTRFKYLKLQFLTTQLWNTTKVIVLRRFGLKLLGFFFIIMKFICTYNIYMKAFLAQLKDLLTKSISTIFRQRKVGNREWGRE